MASNLPEGADLVLDETGVAHLWLGSANGSPVLLSTDLLATLDGHIDDLARSAGEGTLRAVVLRARPAGFIAGTDLRPLRGLTRAADATELALRAQHTLRRLESLTVPTIAVVDGACLGGGLELALACSYRIVSDSPRTRLGLPDVRTGLIPGYGGTVRLPRLVGIQSALELILTGRSVDASEALRIGLADQVISAQALDEEVAGFARDRVNQVRHRTGARRRVRRRLVEDTAPGRRLLLRAARRLIPAGAAAAPRRALDAIAGGVALPLDRAFQREAAIFGQLAVSAETQALIHTQLLLHSTARHPAPPAHFEEVAVLGAGEVGCTLAYLLARSRIQVRLKDQNRAALVTGARIARDRLAGRADAPDARTIVPATGFGGFGTLDFAAFAVGDRAETVREALTEVQDHTSPGCVFALTSPLVTLAECYDSVSAPDRLVGFHLAEPVDNFPLVEIVEGERTSPASLSRALDLARRTGRTAVVASDRPGFLLPRLLGIFFAEAIRLLDDGATVTQVDAALEDAGFTLGPIRRIDTLGSERSLRRLDSLATSLGERFRPAPIAERIRGARDGFYLYRNGRPLTANPALPAGLPALTADQSELIRDRVTLLLLNEAALALEEEVASADAIDLASVLGVGFPRIRGGVLHFATGAGAPLLERFELLASRFGPRFTPAPLVHRLASTVESGHSG